MYECFHFGERAVSWDADFNLDEVEGEGEGIVHTLHCNNCGAEITYVLREKEDDSDAGERT